MFFFLLSFALHRSTQTRTPKAGCGRVGEFVVKEAEEETVEGQSSA